jgi:hypothetical protein
MPISALVLTLDARPERAAEALVWLHARADKLAGFELLLGVPRGDRVPAVVVTDELWQGETAVDELLAAPGISFVDVVSVDFSDLPDEPTCEATWTAAIS